MHPILKQIEEFGLVPMIKIERAPDAVPLAKALRDGGLPVAEITFRTAAAEEAMRNIAAELPEVQIGAGTVTRVEQVEQAVKAGAKFIVTPGFSSAVVKFCVDHKIPVTPGVATPTEIQMALDHGVDTVKFFPAEAFGGLKTLKAMSAPYSMVKFIPTGGISAANLAEYIMFPKVLACGGSWLAKDELIQAGKFDEITRITRAAMDLVLGFEFAHVGLNLPDAAASLALARQFSDLFRFPVKEGNSSNFAGAGLEINKRPGRGAHGHLAVTTNSMPRALAYLRRRGVAIDMESAKQDAAGKLAAVYLKDEFGGFAAHLLQRK